MSQTRKPYHLAPLKSLPVVILQIPQLLVLLFVWMDEMPFVGRYEDDLDLGEHITGAVIGFSEEALR